MLVCDQVRAVKRSEDPLSPLWLEVNVEEMLEDLKKKSMTDTVQLDTVGCH
jgi:hypothetical protein